MVGSDFVLAWLVDWKLIGVPGRNPLFVYVNHSHNNVLPDEIKGVEEGWTDLTNWDNGDKGISSDASEWGCGRSENSSRRQHRNTEAPSESK